MVKAEDCTDGSSSSEIEIMDQKPSLAFSDCKPRPIPDLTSEGSTPSSSSGHLKSYFVGMGFSPTLVDKVFEENGEEDTELLLEALIKLSHAGPEAFNSLDDFSCPVKGEPDSPFEFELDDVDNEHSQYPNEPSTENGDKREYLLTMKFSKEEVDLAINQLGESAPLPELVDFIVTAQTAGINEENISEALFGVMDKTQHLLQMGFTEDEVSHAIDKFGAEASITDLANSIFTRRICRRVAAEEDQTDDGIKIKTEPENLDDELKSCYPMPGTREAKASSSNSESYDYEEKVRVKRAKATTVIDETSFFSGGLQRVKQEDMSDPAFIKKEVPQQINGNARSTVSRQPYFFYGNVVDVSQDTWRRLSEFLYATEPEFVNCQYFSAFMRKEGYIHNLPKGRRFNILPRPAMTLEEALPHTERWWPSWDTRKQLSCINAETKVVSQVCQQIETMLVDSQGIISKEQQASILHHCKTLNLIWVGQYKLSPIEPEQIELILGYPRHHTGSCGLERDGRLQALKHGFQTDTLGYYLSGLKAEHPDGIRVLSLYSGIGGGEVALHRLGIPLACVVSVEASDANRRIMRRWWEITRQSGELIQIGGIEKLKTQMLEGFVQRFSGFDLIIGGNPGFFPTGSRMVSGAMGMDQNLYFEFVRVFQRVRSIMARNN